ncbi:MAG: outer membrane protein assembly factor BamA [Victivallaceae bacterium]|nr:outer membrane protein assembly factor BamA [Victivallaceae bacterium]
MVSHPGARILFLLTVLAAFLPGAFAGRVAALRFEQTGAVKLPEEQLRMLVKPRVGSEYNFADRDADIKRLYRSGYFSDVVLETERGSGDTITLIYKLRLKPRVNSVVLDGNVKFKTRELKKLVTVVPDAPLNDTALRESAQKIREFYRSKGYRSATVTPDYQSAGPDRVDVVFRISEHLRLRVDHVTFEGNKLFGNWKLKYAIATRYNPLSKFFDMGLLDREELSLDRARLRDLYHEEGYLDFKVDKLEVSQQPDDPEFVDLKFVLDEGAPYKTGQSKITGNTVFKTEEILPVLALRKDQTFRLSLEEQSRKAIVSMYETLGHADVTVRAIRTPDYETHTVGIEYQITEGRKYAIRDIVISGNLITKDKVIRRELAIQPGDPLDPQRVEASKNRLMGMGYFEKVNANAVNADAVDEKDVLINVEEKRFFSFKVGAGFSDYNSLAGMAEISNNNFDLFAPGKFFTGGGQRLRLQGMYGIERAGFNLDFTEPWLFDIPLRLDVSGYLNQLVYDNWTEERLGVRVGLTKKFFDDFTSATLGYKFERVWVKDMKWYASPALRQQETGQFVSHFSLLLERDTRDSMLEPTSGYYLSALGAMAPSIIGSTNSFYRVELKGSMYYPLFDKAIILMLGGRLGVVDGFGSSDGVPIFERYFLGGGDSLRGFPYRQVSPNDASGIPMGGSTMMLVTGEISHPIWNFIRGAVFSDIGNVWEKAYDFGSVNIGVGYGLRIKVPYLNAPIRVDLAYPILNNQDGVPSRLRVHFNMGFTW